MNAVQVSDLFCLYPLPHRGTVAALRGLTLTVAMGEKLVVHGPNGSGKTTLLRVLTGEVAPSAGTVRVAGVELAGADDRTQTRLRRTSLGIVDQHAARVLRPELDVVDNVALQLVVAGVARPTARRQARDWLGRLQLDHLADRDPSTLSGGEAQRVCVCAALAHAPSVVLADEPTGELDAVAADALYDLLAAAVTVTGAALVLVSHDARAGRIADRVVRIRDGRLSEQWTPSAPQEEELVVDDRGWVRLPEAMRRQAGLTGAVRPQASAGAVILRDARAAGSAAAPDPVISVEHPVPQGVRREPVASLRAIGVRYGDRVVLDRFSLDLAGGGITVVRGRSGSGKSTLLRVLLGLSDPDAGTVSLAGAELAGLSRAQRADLRREHVSVALQSGALAESLDVEENLDLALTLRGRARDDDVVEQIITQLGLDAVRGRAVRVMSGGERQRVAVARSLVVGPRLVVLDEPTSQQDETHAELVAGALLAAAARGTAVLAATHDPSLVAVAARVVDLDDLDDLDDDADPLR